MKLHHVMAALAVILAFAFILTPSVQPSEPLNCLELVATHQDDSLPEDAPCAASQALWKAVLSDQMVSQDQWSAWFTRMSDIYREPKNSDFILAAADFEQILAEMLAMPWAPQGIDYPYDKPRLSWRSGDSKLILWGSSEDGVHLTYLGEAFNDFTLICNGDIFSTPLQQPETLENVLNVLFLSENCFISDFVTDVHYYWHAGLLVRPAHFVTTSS